LKPIAPKLTLILGDHPRFLYQLGAGAGLEPNGAGLERGTFPSPWITGGPAPPRSRKGRSALTTRISPSCANPAAPATKSRSSTFSTARTVLLLLVAEPENRCRRNSESHGRGVVRPEGPPVDPDLRRAVSGARRSYSPDPRFAGKHSVAAVLLSLEQRRPPSVSGSRPPRSAASMLAGPRPRRGNCRHDPLCVALHGLRTGILFDGDNLVSRASVCT
jgi:hypothetical protein